MSGNTSLLSKVRRPRFKPPQPTPKEQQAWSHFLELAKEFQSDDKKLAPIVAQELDRLAKKGNPLAIQLRKRIDSSHFAPRAADEAPLAPPEPRRVSGIHWGKPPKDSNS